MPQLNDLRYQFRIVPRPGGRERLDNTWGGDQCTLEIDDPYARGENSWYDWLYLGDECASRLYKALGAYLAGKAVRDGG